ncbi:MAG TPA: hypothetical protein VFK89_07785 [Actinomycetota bacterium]|nr:hypothetical protein [Actinomycetota bacterium]
MRIPSLPARETPRLRVLVVSEDAGFLVAAQEALRPAGVHVVACMGPAQSPCDLLDSGSCPLAGHVDAAIVDAPADGVFRHHWFALTASDYAASLARSHPRLFVMLCGPGDQAWPSTAVTVGHTRSEALHLLRWAAETDGTERTGTPHYEGSSR